MWFEIVLWIIIAPIVEFVGYAIYDKLTLKRDFSDEKLENLSNGEFLVSLNSQTKKSTLVGVIGFGVMILIMIACAIGLLFTEESFTIVDFALINVIFNLVCLPFFLAFLHYATKKVYVSKHEIIERSLLVRSRVKINEIKGIETGKSGVEFILIKGEKKSIKVTKNYTNYDNLKQVLKNISKTNY